jgi:hypothetical protein
VAIEILLKTRFAIEVPRSSSLLWVVKNIVFMTNFTKAITSVKPYHHNMCDESIKGLWKDALTIITSIVLIVNMEIELQQVSNGIEVLNEFDIELLLE